MQHRRHAAAWLVAAWVLAACSDPMGPGGRHFHWSEVVAPGDEIEIKGVNGSITATTATGNEVVVSATIRGNDSDPAEVTVEVITHANGVTICAVYPDVPGRLPNVCAPGDGGRMNTGDNDVEVSFTVAVPAGVTFVGRTVNGSVTTTDLESDAFAWTVNGDVTLTTLRVATGFTVNGSVHATIGQTTWARDLDFTSVNGNVTAHVPGGANADVTLSTVNGNITCDFAMSDTGPGWRQGTIGMGGWDLRLTTVNGNVTLRRDG